MRKRSRIKLLGEIINRKFKNASATPPVDGFEKVQSKLSVDSKLKAIVSAKFISGFDAPPANAFEQIQQRINPTVYPTVFEIYKVRAVATLSIIFIASLLLIPTDYTSRTYLQSGENLFSHIPEDAVRLESELKGKDQNIESQDTNASDNLNAKGPEPKSSNNDNDSGVETLNDPLVESQNLAVASQSPVLANLSTPKGIQSTFLSLSDPDQLIPNIDENSIEKEIPVSAIRNVVVEKASLKPYLTNSLLNPDVLFPQVDDIETEVTYFKEKRNYSFFLEFQAFTNQTKIRANPENWLSLTSNQSLLSQQLDFKVGGGVLFPVYKNIKLKAGIHYFQYTKNIEYLIFRSIPGASSKFPEVFYPVGSNRESLNLNSLVANIGIEVPIYKGHYIGVEYDLGRPFNSSVGSVSNIGIYLGLYEFNFAGFTYSFESHFNRSLTFNKAEFFSFQNHTAGISLKIKR